MENSGAVGTVYCETVLSDLYENLADFQDIRGGRADQEVAHPYV